MKNIIKKELKTIQGLLPEGYNISELSEQDRCSVWDMAYLIACASTSTESKTKSDSILEKMVYEIKANHENEIKENLRADVAHFIISRLDSYDGEQSESDASSLKNDVRFKIAPPWVTFVNEIAAMFGDDPDITITYNNTDYCLLVKVDNEEKAAAISTLLPERRKFGNVTLDVVVSTSENKIMIGGEMLEESKVLFETAFKNNPAFSFARRVDYDDFTIGGITYVVFANRVVQFFNDNLNDNFGNVSTLYQEIAKDIFTPESTKGVFFSTDVVADKVGMPLGEWP